MEKLLDRVKAFAHATDWPPVIAATEGLVVVVLLAAALLAPGAPRPVEPARASPPPAVVAETRGAASKTPAPKAAPAKPAPAPKAETETKIAQAPQAAPAPSVKTPSEPLAPPPAAPPGPPPAPAIAPAIAAADLPDTGSDYRKTRRALLNKGFKPARVAPPECRGPEPSVDACWGALVQYPEIESCQGRNGTTCVGWWVAPDGRVLNIRTGGDQSRITERHWARPGEIDELPKGWRP